MLERTRARAELGTAEVLLTRSGVQQDCAAGAVDAATLRQALSAFQTALANPSPPPGAYIQAKARYGIGQIDICLSQARQEDRWDDAEVQFRAVIAEYDAGTPPLKGLAADSHAALGFLALPFSGEPDPAVRTASFTRAADEYRAALAMSGEARPLRRAFYAWSLGLAEEQLGHFDRAEEAFATAAAFPELDAATRSTYEQARDRAHARAG
jgi:hypothetical protein